MVSLRTLSRWLIGIAYFVAGVLHLVVPAPFVQIVPGWVPAPALVVTLTGLCEIAGAAALLQPWSARLHAVAGWSLAAYALCVWPANFNHMLIDMARPDGGLGLGYHVPRLAAQPLLIWWTLWSAGIALPARRTKPVSPRRAQPCH